MMSLIATLVTIAFVAVPIVIVWKVARRLQQVRREFSDPARLQRAFAEHAASALRRAGAHPQSVAKLEVLARQPVAERAAEQRAKAYEARIGLQRRPAAQRPQRPRPKHAPIAGLDMGDSFRLSQPPDQGEPQAPFGISNWVVIGLLLGAAAWFLLR